MADLVLDPVCKMQVDPAKVESRSEYHGKTYYFCCPHCAQKFAAEPEKYLAQTARPAALVLLGGSALASAPVADSAHPAKAGLITIAGPPGAPAPAVAKDPVCGMSVNTAAAKHTLQHAGQTFYFCSPSCREKFQSQPDKYLRPPEGAAALRIAPSAMASTARAPESPGGTTVYTCPMDPEVRQSKPGPCPKCGMDLEPELLAPPAAKVEYTCPMHPEVVSDKPGACSICGMDLEPRTVTAALPEENVELRRMKRRFWVSLVLTVPLLVIAMTGMLAHTMLAARALNWI